MAGEVDPIHPLLVALAAGEDVRTSVVTEVARHVALVLPRLPEGWFEPSDAGAVDALALRLVGVCDTMAIARSPFSGRTVFQACRLGLLDAEAFRRHVVYGRRSLLRELLRSDRAARLSLQSGFAQRVDLYLALGERLRGVARKLPGSPVRWALPRPAPVLAEAPLVARLLEQQAATPMDVDALLQDALRLGGPRTQAGLVRVVSAVLGPAPGGVDSGVSEAVRRRAALDLADDEDAVDLDAEPASGDCVTYRHAEWAVEVREGIVTQIYGPSALTLRIQGQHVPLVRGVPTHLPAAELGPALDAMDVRGRRFHLRRD